MSKPTDKDLAELNELWADEYHMKYDSIVLEKLREYDPEFVQAMEKIREACSTEFYFG